MGRGADREASPSEQSLEPLLEERGNMADGMEMKAVASSRGPPRLLDPKKKRHCPPVAPDQFTPEYFTKLLRESGIGEVKGVSKEVIGEEGQLSVVYRVRLTLTEGTKTVVVKTKNDRTFLPDVMVNKAFRREVFFYGCVREADSVPRPKIFGMAEDGNKFVLAMEELAGSPGDDTKEQPLPYVEKVLEEVAAMHARWWGAVPFEDYPDLSPRVGCFLVMMVRQTFKSAWKTFQKLLPPDSPVAAWSKTSCPLDTLDCIGSFIDRATGECVEDRLTFCHNDLKPSNIFSHEGELRFVDFGGSAAGLGAFDVMYFLHIALDSATLEEKEMDLLKHYHNALSSRGVKKYPWDTFLDDYRFVMMYLMFACAVATQDLLAEKEGGKGAWGPNPTPNERYRKEVFLDRVPLTLLDSIKRHKWAETYLDQLAQDKCCCCTVQ